MFPLTKSPSLPLAQGRHAVISVSECFEVLFLIPNFIFLNLFFPGQEKFFKFAPPLNNVASELLISYLPCLIVSPVPLSWNFSHLASKTPAFSHSILLSLNGYIPCASIFNSNFISLFIRYVWIFSFLCYMLWIQQWTRKQKTDTVYMIMELKIEQGIWGKDLS